MWRNPNYPAPEPAAPQENGQRLATFPRGNGAEMRVNLASFEGKPYVALRVWERGQDGRLWPRKGKGCSVRLSEAAGLIDALQGALAAGGELDRQRDRAAGFEHHTAEQAGPVRGFGGGAAGETSYVPKGRPVRAPWEPDKLPRPDAQPRPFDETA